MRLLYIIFLFLIASCVTNQLDVEKGTFQTIKPPNIYGNGRYLANDTTNYIISYDANIGKNRTIPLHGVMNLHRDCCGEVLSEMPANIYYRLIENTLGFQFYRTIKYDYPYIGFGGGLQNFPYGFFMLGCNGKSIEIGGVAFWGLAINKASYEGSCLYCQEVEYVKFKDVTIFHSYFGLVAHASFYWEKFALGYAASITNPWLVDELPVSASDYADISFWFPALLMQDIGISYTPNKIKYRLGINQITGVEFPGQYWGLSLQMAYLW
jgi:hypothetical protein